jgi:hypothetical protein
MAKHHRKPYRRKDGTWVRGTWVRGSHPKQGCSFWLIGMVAVGAVATAKRRG